MAVKKNEMDEFEQLARARLADVQGQYEALVDSSKPLRDKIDALQAEHESDEQAGNHDDRE